MGRTIKDLPEGKLAQFAQIIRDVIAESREKRESDIAAGKMLTNNPVPVMLTRPMPCPGNAPPPADHEEDVMVYREDRRIQRHRFSIGESTYAEARDAWAAYKPIEAALKELGWSYEEIFRAVPEIFDPMHHVYGVLTLLFHYREDGKAEALMGIRSARLAGTNVGFASFPGGLVKPGECLENAALRELKEEGALGQIEIYPGFSMGAHNAAPSVTFMRAGRTTSREVAPSYEWAGKLMAWVPVAFIRDALFYDDREPLTHAFRSQGIEMDDQAGVDIAGDAILPAKILLEQFIL